MIAFEHINMCNHAMHYQANKQTVYRTFLAVVVLLTVTGCGEFRGLPSLDVTLPQAFTQASHVDGQQKPMPLSQDWWKEIEDETLISILTRIEKQNLSIEQARFRLLAARESARSLDYLPALNISGDAQYNRLIDGNFAINNIGVTGSGSNQKKTTGYYNARLDSSWELPLWGQYSAADDIDKQILIYAESDLAALRANVIAEAVRIYAEMRGFQQQRIKQERVVQALEKITQYQSIKFKAGLVSNTELNQAKRNQLDEKNALETIINNEVASRQQLSALIGQTAPDPAWQTASTLPIINLPELSITPLDVLRNRPDIRRAEASVLQEAGKLELAKADRYPQITLSGNLSQLDNLTGSPLPGKTVQLTGIPAISIPLFDWGKRLAAAKAQDAKLSEIASAYRETVVNAMTEVERFLSAVHASNQNMRQSSEAATLEQKNLTQAELLFKQGLTDGIATENARITALKAEISALQSHVDHLSHIAALTKALGGGVPSQLTKQTSTHYEP